MVKTYWGKDEPANFKQKQGCVLMNSGNGEDDGRWTHTDCNEMHVAICKKPLSEFTFGVFISSTRAARHFASLELFSPN